MAKAYFEWFLKKLQVVCDVENLESWMQNAENIWFGW